MTRDEARGLLDLSREARWTFPSSFGRPVGDDPGPWLERLLARRDELPAAAAALAAGEDPEGAVELAANTWRLSILAGDLAGGRALLAAALAVPGPATRARSLALYGDGLLAARQGRWAESRTRSEEALAAARESGDAEALALAALGLSRAALEDGDAAGARALAQEARAHAAAAAGAPALGQAPLGMEAQAARLAGDLDVAAALFTESLALNRRIGDHGMVVAELVNLGWTQLHRGDVDAAEQLFGEYAAAAGDEDPYDAVLALAARAGVALGRGDGEAAAAGLAEAEALARAAGVELASDDRRELEWLAGRLAAAGRQPASR